MTRLTATAAGVALAFVAFPVNAAQVTARSFDLDCTGTIQERFGHQRPFRHTIHVDLDANTYCVDDCEIVQSIFAHSDDGITFIDRPSDGYWAVNRATWSRSTGAYSAEFAASTRIYTHRITTARCDPAPLSIKRERMSSATIDGFPFEIGG